MGFLDKVKQSATEATQKVKEGAEDVQTKREIGKLEDELGKQTYVLAKAGAVSHPDIDALVAKIDELKAKLEEEEEEESEAEPAAAAAAGAESPSA